jgi:site-specific DNA recombinase
MKVGIYARLSSDRDGESTSVANQVELCRGRFRPDWVEVGVYTDDDISASSYAGGRTRPGLERLLSDIFAGKVDVITARALDRLVRIPRDIEPLIDSGVQIVTTDGLDSATTSGQMVMRIQAAIAKNESDQISSRVRIKHGELRARGRWSGGRRSFGITADGQSVVPEEQALIVEAAQRVVAGEGLATIAREWRRAGVKTGRGTPWNDPSTIGRMLLSPRMVGRRRQASGLSEVGMPALLTEDLWRRASAILTNPARRLTSSTAVKHLLAGLLTCGRCGRPLSSHIRQGKLRWQCLALRDGCGRLTINSGPLEEYIIAAWHDYVSGPEMAELAAARQRLRADRGRDEGALRAALESDRQRLGILIDMFAAGSLTTDEWQRARATLDAKIRATEEVLASTDESDDLAWLTAEGLAATVWEMAPFEDRRRLLAAVIESVTISPADVTGRRAFDPGRVQIKFRQGVNLHPGDLLNVRWLSASA